MKFTFDKKEKTLIIQLEGRLIGEFQTIELNDMIDEYLDEKHIHLIFDLSKLEYINSTGLNFFLKTLTKVRKHDGEVVLCSLNTMLENLLVTTKLSSFFIISKNIDDALAELKKEKA
ncbi:MAG: STAS domain-containing protein [Chitinophagales bacterium]